MGLVLQQYFQLIQEQQFFYFWRRLDIQGSCIAFKRETIFFVNIILTLCRIAFKHSCLASVMYNVYFRYRNLSLPLLFGVWMARFLWVTPANLFIVQIDVHRLWLSSSTKLYHINTVLQVLCRDTKISLFFQLHCDMLTLKLSFCFEFLLTGHTDWFLGRAIVVESSVSSLEFLDSL